MPNPQTYTENELLQRIADGDERAFSQIVDQYASPIHTHLMIYMKDANRAEEITQDILMSIWRYREKLPEMKNFPGYVYVITRNRVKKQLKERILASAEPPEDRLNNLLAAPVNDIESKELLDVIYSGIEKLPPKRKEVFRLSRLEELSHDEISEKLRISKNTIKEHIKEALVFLRNYVRETTGEILSLLAWYWLIGM